MTSARYLALLIGCFALGAAIGQASIWLGIVPR